MDKQNVVHTYNGILLSQYKKWSLDTCYSMDGARRHAEQNKPVTKGEIFCVLTYVKRWEKADI